MRNGRLQRLSRGFTLVELMVGVLIGLIGTVVIFQVFAVSEGQKRTTTGGSDAQQNGVFSLFQVERDIRMAGYSINHMALLGCQTNGWYVPGGQPISFRLVPVEIVDGAGGAPDQVRVAFGDSDLFMAPAKFLADSAPADVFKLENRFGLREGDVVVAAEAGKPCTLAQVNGLPAKPRGRQRDPHERHLRQRPGREPSRPSTTAREGCSRRTTSPTWPGTRSPIPAAGSTTWVRRPAW